MKFGSRNTLAQSPAPMLTASAVGEARQLGGGSALGAIENNDERISNILFLLNTRFRVTTADVSQYLHIAPSTARKLLADMEHQGLLIRTYGGAISVDANKDVLLTQKLLTNVDQKRQIAACARKYVKDGERIAVAGGSTVLEFCNCLHDLKRSVVITDSLTAANALIANQNIEVQICAGILSQRSGCIVGPNAVKTFSETTVDKAFIGVDGIELEQGFWSDNILIGKVERQMAQAARQVFILVDSSKMGRNSVYPLMPLSEANYIVTNHFKDKQFVRQLQRHGCQLIFCDPEPLE